MASLTKRPLWMALLSFGTFALATSACGAGEGEADDPLKPPPNLGGRDQPSGDAGTDAGPGDGGTDPGLAAPRLVQLAAGTRHTCALWSDGVVKCWGGNQRGQLGLEHAANVGFGAEQMGAKLPAVDLGGGARAVWLAAGGESTCAVLESGALKCWGGNGWGQLGLGDGDDRGRAPGEMGLALNHVSLGTARTAKEVAIGDYSTCALLDDGTVKCWGANFGGELGYGDAFTRGRGEAGGAMGDALRPVDIGFSGVQTLRMTSASAYQSSCALNDLGKLKCWGGNDRGQLGLGDLDNRGDDVGEMGGQLPVVPIGERVRFVAAGREALCAGLDNGQMRCWGSNVGGRLGLGDAEDRGGDGRNLPLIDLGVTTPIANASLLFHGCAAFDDGRMKCWGPNGNGQLGYGDTQSRGAEPGQMGTKLPFVDLGALEQVRQIVTGSSHTCVRLANERVKCWGGNESGQLGYGDTQSRGDSMTSMGAALPYVELGR